MNLSRRNFSRLLGLAPVTARLAAKAAADAEIAKLAGIVGSGSAPTFQASGGYGSPAPISSDDYLKTRIAAAHYAKIVGMPDFVKEMMRRNSQYVGQLDPDLAAKRSWSMSVKILTQRERNMERLIEQIEYGAWLSQGQSTFKKLTGWDWPW